jgi:hypothetical protein
LLTSKKTGIILMVEANVGEKEYLSYLSPEHADRFRYRHSLERGRIIRFRVQYEALIGGEWRAIVRYDTAHGRPHKDLLHPDGTQDKHEFYGYSREEILTLGERDIKANWKRYRAAYEQEMGR